MLLGNYCIHITMDTVSIMNLLWILYPGLVPFVVLISFTETRNPCALSANANMVKGMLICMWGKCA